MNPVVRDPQHERTDSSLYANAAIYYLFFCQTLKKKDVSMQINEAVRGFIIN